MINAFLAYFYAFITWTFHNKWCLVKTVGQIENERGFKLPLNNWP